MKNGIFHLSWKNFVDEVKLLIKNATNRKTIAKEIAEGIRKIPK